MFDTAHGFQVTGRDLTTHTTGLHGGQRGQRLRLGPLRPGRSKLHRAAARLPPDVQHRDAGDSELQRRPHRQHLLRRRDRSLRVLRSRPQRRATRTCDKPLGDDTNNPDNAGPDPLGDDVFCLPASASTRIKIGGCLNTDGDFDSVSYKFSWPGSISNPIADSAAERASGAVHQPAERRARNFPSMAFESNISRSESDDTRVRRRTRHASGTSRNPADPQPRSAAASTRHPGPTSTPSTAPRSPAAPAGGSKVGPTSPAPPTSSAAARTPSTARCARSPTRPRRSAPSPPGTTTSGAINAATPARPDRLPARPVLRDPQHGSRPGAGVTGG